MRPVHAQGAASAWTSAGREGTAVLPRFSFAEGGALDSLRVHYTTLGTPRRDATGVTTNAVLVLHGTGGTGRGFLNATFAGGLFGPGQLLDSAEYYIILPDGIGHRGSSKPSDGLRARFPRYGYRDMVKAHHRQAPTRDAADSVIRAYLDARMRTTDANDFLYQFDASRDYDPSPYLARITAPVLHINSQDDLLNPPELGLADTLIRRLPQGRFINLPITAATRGHGTHSVPAIRGHYLREFVAALPRR
jgi:homoserine acetyltransferase